jgi:F-box protein, helicase, 18
MKPTREQEAILNSDGRIIRINARAGTGKTTTLVMLAEMNQDKRALYLVFNRKAREAAQKKFPSNVDVHTIHSLAFRREGYRWKENLGSFNPVDLLPAFDGNKNAHQLAGISHQFLTYFLNSPYSRLEDATGFFAQHLTSEMTALLESHQEVIIQACRDIATAWNRREKPCPHDFYLKLFHKSGQFDRELNRFDTILVDEAQDLSPIMLNALDQCRKRIVLVGDSHQQIYSFRYAMDAMKKLTCDQDFDLTLSFRFGSAIAELASAFIQEAKKEKGFLIKGNPDKSSMVSLSSRLPSNNLTRAILTRTNLSLFSNAMQLRSAGKAFHFERDLQPVLFRSLDVYWLSRGQKERIRDVFIASFSSLEQLEEYAGSMSDFPLTGMAQIVKKYGDDSFPAAVFEMADLSRSRNTGKGQDGVTLSTIHTAKGQEYDEVYLDSDIAENLSAATQNESRLYEEEVNIAYVGITRAVKRLHLAPAFQTLLTERWKDRVRGYPGGSTAKAGKSSGTFKKITESSRRKLQTIGGDTPKTEAKSRAVGPRVSIGEVVQTSHGRGRIIEISGEECLIDLEKQPARLWERLSRLSRIS